MLHIGMFCEKSIFDDKRNNEVIANISTFCGKFSVLPSGDVAQIPVFDALIINGPQLQAAEILELMPKGSFVLINTDKRNSNSLIRRYSGTLITYGLNQKACITASSIIDEEQGGQLQICIQRGFPAISGECATVQEFPVHMHSLGVEATIALVGLMLVCGAKVDIINKAFNSV